MSARNARLVARANETCGSVRTRGLSLLMFSRRQVELALQSNLLH